MGSGLVRTVFDHWPGIKGREKVALLYLASVATDDARPPRYWGPWERIAWSIGYDPEKGNPETARRETLGVLKALRAKGAIVTSGQARRGVRSEYALTLNPGETFIPEGSGRDIRWVRVPREAPKDSVCETLTLGAEWVGESHTQPVGESHTQPVGESHTQPVGESHTPNTRVNPRIKTTANPTSSPQATNSPGLAVELAEEEAHDSGALVDHFARELEAQGVTPKRSSTWRAAAGHLLEKDSPEIIGAVIRYALTDQFWAGKVLTLPKLAQHYDQLRMRARAVTEATGTARGRSILSIPTTDYYSQAVQPDQDDKRMCVECFAHKPKHQMKPGPNGHGWQCITCTRTLEAAS